MAKRKPMETVAELRAYSWKDYMKSRHWKKFSKSLLDEETCVCGLCGIKRWNGVYVRGKNKGKRRRLRQFHCHHLNYSSRGAELRKDVMVLCAKCHETAHSLEMLARSRGGMWSEMYDLLLKITVWDYTKFNSEE
jgi:hypothetical protein